MKTNLGEGPYGKENRAVVTWPNKFIGNADSSPMIRDCDILYYRYALAVMLDAELKYYRRDYAGALASLNIIAKRAYGKENFHTSATQGDVLKALCNEYLLEFPCEGVVWWALIRLDRIWGVQRGPEGAQGCRQHPVVAHQQECPRQKFEPCPNGGMVLIENLKLRNMRLNFKKYMAGLATAATLLLTACYEDHTDLEDRTTRIRISPEIEAFEADGTASVSGNNNVTSVVLVKVGTRVSRMEWEAELVDWMPSVDETGPWATIQRVPVVSQYTEIAGPNTVAVTQSGFELTALPNTGYGRRCTVRITAEDGTVQDYELFQYGELADAEVVPALESVEISFQGDPVDLAYTTNMGDKYAYAIAYEEGGAEGWLTAEHRGEGLLTLTAEPWDDMERDRRATLTITVGDDETSKAAVDIPSCSLGRRNTIMFTALRWARRLLRRCR